MLNITVQEYSTKVMTADRVRLAQADQYIQFLASPEGLEWYDSFGENATEVLTDIARGWVPSKRFPAQGQMLRSVADAQGWPKSHIWVLGVAATAAALAHR